MSSFFNIQKDTQLATRLNSSDSCVPFKEIVLPTMVVHEFDL